jgi:hypothetical protein
MSEKIESDKEKRKYATTAYPKNSLMDALRIAQSIKDNNAGKPYDLLDLATSVKYSPASSGFRTLITSSARYGLTAGSYKAKQIALTPLGLTIVSPQNSQERADGLKKALFNIELFRRFFTDFENNKLPEMQYLVNTLNRTYGIPSEDCEDCYNMIVRIAEELNILDEFGGGTRWIHLSKLSKIEVAPTATPPTGEEELPAVTGEEGVPPQISPEPTKEEKPIVFISHSKNALIVDQIKTILEFGQFDYRIAEETETTAIPIPEKVFGTMRECNCAIINVSADEPEKKDDGTYGVNPNVLTEIGGAFLQYNRKVILLVDRRVQLPSNLQGLYRCEYEGEELAFSTYQKLQKELAEFRRPSKSAPQ